VAQPDDRQQELVGRGEVEVVAAPVGAGAAGSVQPQAAVGGEGPQQLGQQVAERLDRQPGHRPEDGGVLAQVLAAKDQGDLDLIGGTAHVPLS
jgi:hypothetical protein